MASWLLTLSFPNEMGVLIPVIQSYAERDNIFNDIR